ncbi:hypothetical protein BS47DRAFT_1388638 [Hydnum rufescens UP504]|uniref:Uncharacterized protein n=1 Tax=Hydnum rufescens UP504 TaxID=1448309 RepID=A0A9P6B7J2_9AGAM|nr:hypothetical protein BS47DRAFT_1388638 [Hydnum rufescens UP504]
MTKRLLRQGAARVPTPPLTTSSAPSSSSPSSSHLSPSIRTKRRNRSKFPTAEVVSVGPSGVIMTESSQIGGYPSGPVVWSTFIESCPLDIDFEPELAPEVHIHLDQDKCSRHARQKHAQARHWGDEVDPAPSLCTCNEKHCVLRVVCVHMEYLERVQLIICKHNPATAQLFASELFVRMGPNERAWAATMTKYLKARGHEFATVDSLRRRFANALSHYQVLVRLVNAEMAKIIDSFHDPLLVPSVSSTSLTSLPSGAPTSLGSSGPSVPSISSLPSAAQHQQDP